MKKLLACLALAAAVFAPSAWAQDAASAAASAVADAVSAVAAAWLRLLMQRRPRRRCPTRATPPGCCPPARHPDDGAWLALFYGGLVRSKNMLSVLMQVMVGFSLIVVLWCCMATASRSPGQCLHRWHSDRLFMKGIWDNVAGTFSNAATFSKGVVIPSWCLPPSRPPSPASPPV